MLNCAGVQSERQRPRTVTAAPPSPGDLECQTPRASRSIGQSSWDALVRGEEKICALLEGSALRWVPTQILIETDTEHRFVLPTPRGWACRTRLLPDGRNQFILVFLPGDLFAVKSLFITRHTDAVMSLSPIVAERIDYCDLHAAYVKDSDIATRCIWQVLEEERRLHSWVTGCGPGQREERLALLLVDFRGRLVCREPSRRTR